MSSRPATELADGASVQRIDECELAVGCGSWGFMTSQAGAIEAHWQAEQARNPNYFNGRIYVLEHGEVAGRRFSGRAVPADFKTYLYWRHLGYPESGVRDVFGSALIRSREGHVLLGRQQAGHINAGRIYPPGGFIDARDVGRDGRIDIAASTARELAEETGLDPLLARLAPGTWVTRLGPHVSLAHEFAFDLGSAALREEILLRMRESDDELSDIVVVRTVADLTEDVLPFAQALVRAVFAA